MRLGSQSDDYLKRFKELQVKLQLVLDKHKVCHQLASCGALPSSNDSTDKGRDGAFISYAALCRNLESCSNTPSKRSKIS